MEIFKKVLKEIGIAFILILVIAGVAIFAFYDKIPFARQIPESVKYSAIDRNDYSVSGDVENIKNDTETYMSSSKELRYYELIKLVLPGRIYPFGSINAGTDIPTEYVNQSSGQTTTTAEAEKLEQGEEVETNDEVEASNEVKTNEEISQTETQRIVTNSKQSKFGAEL